MKNFFKNWNKKQKIGVVSGCVVLVVVIAGSMALNSVGNKLEVAHAEEQAVDAGYQKELKQAITNLYTDSTHEQVSEDVTANQVAEIKRLLVTHSAKTADNEKSKKASELEEELVIGIQMWDIQTKLTSFAKVTGEINEAEGYSTIEVDAVIELLKTMKETKVEFYGEKMDQATKIKAEFVKINEAKAVVDGFFVEGEPTTVKEEVTREQLDVAKGKVSEIRQPSLKVTLESQLALVENALSEREAVVASEEKAAQEAAVVAEQAAQQAQASAATSAAQSTGTQGSSNAGTGDVAPQEQASSAPAPQTPPASSNNNNNMNPGDKWEGQENGNTGWITGEGGNTWNEFEW